MTYDDLRAKDLFYIIYILLSKPNLHANDSQQAAEERGDQAEDGRPLPSQHHLTLHHLRQILLSVSMTVMILFTFLPLQSFSCQIEPSLPFLVLRGHQGGEE